MCSYLSRCFHISYPPFSSTSKLFMGSKHSHHPSKSADNYYFPVFSFPKNTTFWFQNSILPFDSINHTHRHARLCRNVQHKSPVPFHQKRDTRVGSECRCCRSVGFDWYDSRESALPTRPYSNGKSPYQIKLQGTASPKCDIGF